MSRIGKKALAVPSDVKTIVNGNSITAQGAKGSLTFYVPKGLGVEFKDNILSLILHDNSKNGYSMWGMARTRLFNIITGVKDGFEKKLEIVGVGYRAALQGSNLNLTLGFSHDVIYKPPGGITLSVPKPTEIVVSGIDKQQVGQVAAEIRAYRLPEPYKGKGIRLSSENVVRKEGKKK